MRKRFKPTLPNARSGRRTDVSAGENASSNNSSSSGTRLSEETPEAKEGIFLKMRFRAVNRDNALKETRTVNPRIINNVLQFNSIFYDY